MASTTRRLHALILGAALITVPTPEYLFASQFGIPASNPQATDPDIEETLAVADAMEGSPETELILRGNAIVRKPGVSIKGDAITYTQLTDEVRVKGNAQLERSGLQFRAPEAVYHLDSKSGETNDSEFEYAPNHLRGEAKCVRFQQDDSVELENSIITTCPKGDNSWLIEFDKLTIDEYTQQGTGRNAVLKLGGVPVFGTPWFTFPTSGQRQSGFLTPSIGYGSSRGLELVIPYYFNIAPNYDYTVAPRIYSKSGVGIDNQLRWKTEYFDADLGLNYLHKDRNYNDEKRWGVFGKLTGSYKGLGYGINYNRVSDGDYTGDFGSGIRDSEDTTLAQDFWVDYSRDFWSTSLAVRKNQTLTIDGITYDKPYEKVPQFTWRALAPDFHGLELSTVLEATRFKHPTKIDGDRFVVDQTVSYPMRGASWFVTPKAELIGTWYKLEREYEGKKNPSRFLPVLSMDSGLIFEREFSVNDRETIQTLEPRLFYAYAPKRDQKDIPIFDSGRSDLNFAQLFTEKTWSSYDRVDEANQLTAALTTRILDGESGDEWFRAAVGERFYFTDYEINYKGERVERANKSHSDMLASIGAKLFRNVSVSAFGQYNHGSHNFRRANAGISWQPKPFSVISLFYRKSSLADVYGRYRQDDYISSGEIIDQIDFSTQWPLTSSVSAVGRFNYSLEDRKPIDILAGVEYTANCWTLRLVGQRYLRSENKNENRFFVQLELHGLGGIGKNPLGELTDSIHGYQSTSNGRATMPGQR